MENEVKVGFLARDNNKGLGIESLEFVKHMNPYKTLVVEFPGERCFRRRFPESRITMNRMDQEDINWILDGIDVLFSIETFYSADISQQAKERGIKRVLRINWEWFNIQEADLYIAPSLWNFSKIPKPKKYLPFPINREKLPFKVKKYAKVFLHNAGNLNAGYDRNGTDVFLKAVPLVKSNVKFIVKTQGIKIPRIKDTRVHYIDKDYNDYWTFWEEVKADVLVYPRRYTGQSLPLNEAMSVGMAIIMTDMLPQNGFLPKELLVKPAKFRSIKIFQEIEIAQTDPKDLAAKIDEVANMNITKYSQFSDHIAANWSWGKLKEKYLNTFKELCQKET